MVLRGAISPLLLLGNDTGPFPRGTSLLSEVSNAELSPEGYVLRSYERDLHKKYDLANLLAIHREALATVQKPFLEKLVVARAKGY